MRGCHAFDHRASNEEMWNRPNLPPVIVPEYRPPIEKPYPVAKAAVEEQGIGE